MKTLNPLVVEKSALAGLSDKDREALDDISSVAHYKAGDWLFREGTLADRFFLLNAGHVSLEIYTPQRGSRPIQTINRGELFGTSWLVPPYTWQLDARALDPVTVIVFNAHQLVKKMESDHEFGYQMMKTFLVQISHRLTAAQKEILRLYANPE